MPKLEENKAFIESVRAIDESLANIKLNNITVNRLEKEVVYTFICNKTVSVELQNKIYDCVNMITPKCFINIQINVKKIISDKDMIQKEIKELMKREYTSVSYLLEDGDVYVTYHDGFVKYTLNVIESTNDYIIKNGVLQKITDHLQKNFCDNFVGATVVKEGAIDKAILNVEVSPFSIEKVERRVIKVGEVTPIDEKENVTDLATYIEDAQCAGAMTLCGTVISIREKQTKTGKPFFIFDFSDTTGKTSGLYFTRKNTVDKIREIKEGDGIICSCSQDFYNDKLSLKINKINRCLFPTDFVPQRKSKKDVPQKYTLVFPSPNETVKEVSLLNMNDELPKCLSDNEFVVLDLETSGLTAKEDKITEIGAVRIKGGKITELFETLVNPQKVLLDENIALTGITNEMVKDANTFDKVIGDFYKFCNGVTLIGHNIDGFDIKMLRAQADDLGYYFDNKTLDTMNFARDVVYGVSNYKLNTLAEHFKIEFHHHRALSDAYATAELFIELVKIKKCLPNL